MTENEQQGQDEALDSGKTQTNASLNSKNRKPRRALLNTQEMKVLAPLNDLAKSALEIRQGIEEHVPPGKKKEELIKTLKEDVSDSLITTLEELKARQKKES